MKSTTVRSPALDELAALFFRPRTRYTAAPWTPDWTEHVLEHGELTLRGWSRGGGRAVLLVHGWEGAAAQLRPIADALHARGLRTVAYDLPAHGESTGDWASLPLFADAIRTIVRHHGPFEAVVAHSLGAPATVLALDVLAGAKLALIAPAAEPEHFIRGFGRAAALDEASLPALITAVERHIGWPVDALHAAPRIRALSTDVLVLHDRADKEVPFEHGDAIARAAPLGRMVELPGAGHRRIVSDPRTLAAIAELLAPA